MHKTYGVGARWWIVLPRCLRVDSSPQGFANAMIGLTTRYARSAIRFHGRSHSDSAAPQPLFHRSSRHRFFGDGEGAC